MFGFETQTRLFTRLKTNTKLDCLILLFIWPWPSSPSLFNFSFSLAAWSGTLTLPSSPWCACSCQACSCGSLRWELGLGKTSESRQHGASWPPCSLQFSVCPCQCSSLPSSSSSSRFLMCSTNKLKATFNVLRDLSHQQKEQRSQHSNYVFRCGDKYHSRDCDSRVAVLHYL